jgi:hypothetical protein
MTVNKLNFEIIFGTCRSKEAGCCDASKMSFTLAWFYGIFLISCFF